MTYWNTNREEADTLKNSKAKAATQQDTILEFFKDNPLQAYSPEEVHEQTGLNCPLTSVRRAMSNLKGEGLILKTDLMVMGSYGKYTHAYAYNRNGGKTVLF